VNKQEGKGMEKKKILLFSDWYEPGYKAGGPIRSCVNFVQHMKEDYRIYVFTSDRDLGAEGPYPDIATDKWTEAEGSVQIFYCSPGLLSMKQIREQIILLDPDFLYLNSMFSRHFTISPLLVNRWLGGHAGIVLSPRGMLRTSAIRFKSLKKKFFLNVFRWMGFQRTVRFHAADATEQKDIQHWFGKGTKVFVMPNLPGALPPVPGPIEKQPGALSMLFVGRIHPIKNLDYLLELLRPIPSLITLTIVGSLEDKAYWEKCREIIGSLPANITVKYLGEMASHKIAAVIGEHHIFALPTKGENFGHAIFEALSLKKPVLISDQTPWRRLQQARAGWDLPLAEPAAFAQAILQAASWDQGEYDEWSGNAHDLGLGHRDNSNAMEKYRQLFS